MKYLIILGDGMGDLPIAELGNRTPLETARTPNLDRIVSQGRVGLMQTIFPNLPIGSIVANMGILGFNPYEYYPHGRASFEALAKGIVLKPDDIAFRCNLISLNGKCIRDFTAGNINDEDARNVLARLKIAKDSFEIEVHPGMSYRNLLIIRDAGFPAYEIVCFEPHMNIGEEIHDILPHGRSNRARKFVPLLREILLDSIKQFKDINRTFQTKADMIWLWSPSAPPEMPNLQETYGITGAIVCGMDFLKGIGVDCGMQIEHIPGANAYIDTNYAGKLAAAKKFLQSVDLVYVHINAPDEEGHKRDPQGKVRSIELIDRNIIGPLYEFCETNYPESYRMMILPDHYTLLSDGTHTDHLVPVALYGAGVHPDSSHRLTENEAAEEERDPHGRSFSFMKTFLQQGSFGQ